MPEFSAPAKLNLTLEVLGRRFDGYHEIRSVMQTVDLCDKIWLEPAPVIRLKCSEPELETGDNLAYRAAVLLREETGCEQGALLRVEKGIPLSSGLGGGSSDAAAVLLGLNGLWCLGLSLGRLKAVGAQLGSDVPFFLHGGVALVEGRGEIVCPFDSRDRAEFWAVLLVPDLPAIPGKTQALYNSLEQASFTRGESSWRLAEELIRTGAVEPSLLFNVFESVAWDVFPGLDGCRELFQECGASSVHLAGSGPVLFTLLGDRDRAEAICGSLRREGMEAHAVQALGRDHV